MKSYCLTRFSLLLLLCPLALAAPPSDSNTIALDETGVKNLRIETVEVSPANFEETVFALGRVEEAPQRRAALSSRISGRIVEIKAFVGDSVNKGDTLVRVESRQPGDPPPIIDLKAPIDGLITESHVRVGEPVEPDKELLDITDLREVSAIARVPEHHAGKLKPDTRAHIRVSALGDTLIDGELLRFGTAADRESGTLDAIFRVPNPDLRMRPGMRAEFSIVLEKRENVTSVPRTALQGDTGNRYVYVKHFDLPNVFIKTPVQVGAMNDRFVEIVSGLLPADEVVTRGAYSLSFAGANSVSLKAVLDAAHGHEHAEDGGELTPQEREARAAARRAAAGQPSTSSSDGGSRLWMIVSGVLFLLLLVSLLRHRTAADHNPPAP